MPSSSGRRGISVPPREESLPLLPSFMPSPLSEEEEEEEEAVPASEMVARRLLTSAKAAARRKVKKIMLG